MNRTEPSASNQFPPPEWKLQKWQAAPTRFGLDSGRNTSPGLAFGPRHPVTVNVSLFGWARMLSESLYAHHPQYQSLDGGRSPTMTVLLVPSDTAVIRTGFRPTVDAQLRTAKIPF